MNSFTSAFAFADNPLWVPLDATEAFDPSLALDYTVAFGELLHTLHEYRGRMEKAGNIEISDLAREFVEPYPAPVPTSVSWMSSVVSVDAPAYSLCRAERRRVTFLSEWANIEGPILLPGGLSNRQLLCGAGVPLMGSASDPFLSSRGRDGFLMIGEAELSPLYFIAGEKMSVWLEPVGCSPEEVLSVTVPPGVHCIDLAEARRKYALEQGVIPSVFDVKIGIGSSTDKPQAARAARIIIAESPAADDICVVRFRNSFEVEERLALYGRPMIAIGKVDDDDGSDAYYAPERLTGEYVPHRRRLSLVRSVSLTTPVLTDALMATVEDMLAAPEVWIPGLFGREVRALPQLSDISYTRSGAEPQRLTIKFRLSDGEPRSMERDLSPGGRIFEDTFDTYFN